MRICRVFVQTVTFHLWQMNDLARFDKSIPMFSTLPQVQYSKIWSDFSHSNLTKLEKNPQLNVTGGSSYINAVISFAISGNAGMNE